MQHALGEGARLATLCYDPDPDTGCSHPGNAEIKAKISDKVFGTGVGDFDDPTVTDGTGYKDLSVTFSMPMNFLLFNGPTINLTRTKRVYLAT
jgi:hypothetical protein